MAKWKVGDKMSPGSLKGTFEYSSGAAKGDSTWVVEQDEKPFLEKAKQERDNGQRKDIGYKKFATIPDIVAIDILSKYGIDIHKPETMQDKTLMTKFKNIIKSEYAYLLSY
tara:strand:- start:3085 stop:3417 length:333 start_codon:yes stop_codon:yes gene_type:complete